MKNVHKLTEGAIILAIFAVLLILTIFVPIIGIATNLFLALPFMLFAAKNDGKSSFVFLVSAVLISFIVGSMLAIPVAFSYGSAGIIMGYLIYKQKSRVTIFLAGSFAFLINLVAAYAVSVAFFEIDLIDELINILRQSINQSTEMAQTYGNEKNIEKIKKQFESGIDLIKVIMPSIFLLGSFFQVFLIQLVSFPVMKRFGVKVDGWSKMSEISLPKSILWYYLITMLATMMIQPSEGTYLYGASVNLTYVLQFLMVFQGLTFVFHFFEKKGLPKTIPIVITVFTFMMPNLLYIVRILGIIDLGFDLRSRIKK